MSTGVYLFIDGNYLNERWKEISREWFDGAASDFDYVRMGEGFTKVFYYDCLPAKAVKEEQGDFDARHQAQLEFFDRLRALNGWHVHEGVSRARKSGPASQKEVDILIAVDMLTHTHRKNMERLAFLAGDQDFRPLVEAVVRDGMFVSLLYSKRSISTDLLHAADNKIELDLDWFYRSMTREFQIQHQLPSRGFSDVEVVPADGVLLERGMKDGVHVAKLWLSTVTQAKSIHSALPVHGNMFAQMSFHGDVLYLKRAYDNFYGPVAWEAEP